MGNVKDTVENTKFLEAVRLANEALRKCLFCGIEFVSKSKFNRMCDKCKESLKYLGEE